LQVLSRVSPVVLGDPQGCPRQPLPPVEQNRERERERERVDARERGREVERDGEHLLSHPEISNFRM
jgi:hypothetical protein